MSEEEILIEGCKKKDQAAQGKLYQRYASRMKGLCLRYSKNEEEAKDILQEGFIKIFTHIDSFIIRQTGSFEGWMKRIIINTAISYYKKNKKLNQSYSLDDFENTLHEEGSEEEELGHDFSQEELLAALQELPEIFRIVFNLFYIEDYSHRDISEILSIDEKTSRTRLFRAKDLLRKKLQAVAVIKTSKVNQFK